MIPPELRARIRRLFFAEHWKVGTIAAELGVHHETVMRAIGADRFVRPDALVRRSLLDLQGDPDRPLAEGPEIGAEVLLRRQVKLGNLVHGKLLGLAAKRGRWCLVTEELPLPSQPPRTSDSHKSRDTN